MVDQLGAKYGEVVVASGVTNGGYLLEVFASKRGETFTIIRTSPQGMSCMVSAGEGLRLEDAKPTGNGI